MSYDPKATGNRIRNLRKERKLSQVQVAIDLNVSRELISKIECSIYQPSVELVVLLSEYYSVSTDYILRGNAVPFSIASDLQVVIDNLTRIKKSCDLQ